MVVAVIADHLFWFNLGKIVWIDVLLSGDNAVVIAVACAALRGRQRAVAMLAGTLGAVVLRIACTGVAASLLAVPYLRLVAGLVLLYIAAKLLAPDYGESVHKSHARIWAAIGTIVLADITMSIDNVVAVAAASGGDLLLLGVGLALSIPICIGGASIIAMLIDRFPIFLWAGAGLLGWVAADVIVSDPIVVGWVGHQSVWPGIVGVVVAMVASVAGRLIHDLKSVKT